MGRGEGLELGPSESVRDGEHDWMMLTATASSGRARADPARLRDGEVARAVAEDRLDLAGRSHCRDPGLSGLPEEVTWVRPGGSRIAVAPCKRGDGDHAQAQLAEGSRCHL